MDRNFISQNLLNNSVNWTINDLKVTTNYSIIYAGRSTLIFTVTVGNKDITDEVTFEVVSGGASSRVTSVSGNKLNISSLGVRETPKNTLTVKYTYNGQSKNYTIDCEENKYEGSKFVYTDERFAYYNTTSYVGHTVETAYFTFIDVYEEQYTSGDTWRYNTNERVPDNITSINATITNSIPEGAYISNIDVSGGALEVTWPSDMWYAIFDYTVVCDGKTYTGTGQLWVGGI